MERKPPKAKNTKTSTNKGSHTESRSGSSSGTAAPNVINLAEWRARREAERRAVQELLKRELPAETKKAQEAFGLPEDPQRIS